MLALVLFLASLRVRVNAVYNTMFEISFANWVLPCRALLDHVDEAFSIFFLVYRCRIGFA